MPTYPAHIRRLKAVELAIRAEMGKPVGERELDMDRIVENAGKIEKFVNEAIRDPN